MEGGQWMKGQPEDDWYVYALSEKLPEKNVSGGHLHNFLDEIDSLLRKGHDEDYYGIAYPDDLAAPAFIKIYDPNNLGISCELQ